jgi:hypothetical protein
MRGRAARWAMSPASYKARAVKPTGLVSGPSCSTRCSRAVPCPEFPKAGKPRPQETPCKFSCPRGRNKRAAGRIDRAVQPIRARWCARSKTCATTIVREAPFPIRGVQVDGGAEFKPVFEAECHAGLNSSCCRPSGPTSRLRRMRPIDLALRVLRNLRSASPYRQTTALRRRLHPSREPPQAARALGGRTQRSISKRSAEATPSRLICGEPG